jgi:hypothetical protein
VHYIHVHFFFKYTHDNIFRISTYWLKGNNKLGEHVLSIQEKYTLVKFYRKWAFLMGQDIPIFDRLLKWAVKPC